MFLSMPRGMHKNPKSLDHRILLWHSKHKELELNINFKGIYYPIIHLYPNRKLEFLCQCPNILDRCSHRPNGLDFDSNFVNNPFNKLIQINWMRMPPNNNCVNAWIIESVNFLCAIYAFAVNSIQTANIPLKYSKLIRK